MSMSSDATTQEPVALNHVEEGPGDAPVLVLGPSLDTDLGLFDAQARAMADRFRVIPYDLRGHGGSPVVPGPYGVADLEDDVRRLLDALGIDRFAYAGVSLGGAIGLQLAVTVPERLTHLIVVAPAARFRDPRSWKARADRVRAEGTEFLVPRVSAPGSPRASGSPDRRRPSGCWRCCAALRGRATRPAARRSRPSTSGTGCPRSLPPPWSSREPTIREAARHSAEARRRDVLDDPASS